MWHRHKRIIWRKRSIWTFYHAIAQYCIKDWRDIKTLQFVPVKICTISWSSANWKALNFIKRNRWLMTRLGSKSLRDAPLNGMIHTETDVSKEVFHRFLRFYLRVVKLIARRETSSDSLARGRENFKRTCLIHRLPMAGRQREAFEPPSNSAILSR